MTQLSAQDSRGRVVGQVLDSTGAAVPESTVLATNSATGVVVRTSTNAAGAYSLPYLLPGMYTITAEKDGFKKFSRDNIQVRVNDSVELIIEMQIGNVSESISVSAESPLLQTAEATLGQVVDERRITELPLFAGNAMDLVHLAPGTVNGTDMRLRKAPFNNAPSQFSTVGGGNYNNDFTIDGVSNTYSDGTSPRVAYSPPAMSITEFKVQTASYDASIGNTIGATVNVSTKGGTNQLHGEFHEWIRNSALDTKNIFQNRSGQELPVYQDNRFGNSLGGPVYIPKIYDGRNKTFWFYSWEANLFGNPQSYTTTVPTDKMRNGDLSEYLALGANYQVYDPFSTATAPNGRFSRTPIPGNIIPASRLDRVAQNMMKLYPAANFTTNNREIRNNFFNTNKALETYWSTIFRFDHAFSDTHRVFVRFHKDYWEEDKNRTFNNDINGIVLNRTNKGIAIDDVYVFSPSFLMNIRYGVTYQDFPERRVSRGFDLASLGFSSQLTGLIPRELATIPRTAVTPFQEFSAWESGDGVTASLIHNPVATFTWMKGSHNVRFGTDMRIYRENRNRFNAAVSPQFSFNSTYTRGPLDSNAAPQLGGEAASFLLGVPAGSMSITDSTAEQSSVFGFYIQDDYKMTRKLTVNLGLRYEYDTPITERFDRAVSGFAFDQTNPISAQATANYARNPIPELPVSAFRVNGGLLFAGVNGDRNYWQGERNNFMPRIGLAYQLDPKTVARAGYGLFFNSIGILTTNTIVTGFSQSTPIQATLDNGLSFIATTANPFPNGLVQPAKASGGLSTNLGQGISFFPSKRLNPYAQRWSAGVQREMPLLFLLEATYVGNRGTRLNANRDWNALPNEWLSTSPVRDQTRINYLAQAFPNPFRGTNPIYGANTSRSQLLRPYPQFGNITGNDPIGYAWYHSLQVRVERRFNRGFTYQLSYTWSKSMEAVEFLNAADVRPSEVISGGDRTHRFTSSGIWEIPFGKGRAFGNTWHPVAEFVLGGWQLGGVYQRQSGGPLGFGNRIFNGDLNNILLPKDQRSVNQWFNVNAGFNRITAQQLASNLRTFPLRFSGIRGPNQDRWDFSLIKNFKIKERFNTQFRAETFNAWNHPNLSNPNTDPTNANFGVITGQNPPRSWQFALQVKF
ncbi:MAG: TonB-dependent receptor [Bryobacterales bacterium]|nr:TonB-dependent receptor [Bryobacterales bacterium]